MTNKTIEQLLDEALDAFEDPATTVTSLVRRALRIATKRQDYLAVIRLTFETMDLTAAGKPDNPALEGARANLVALLGADVAGQAYTKIAERHIRDRSSADGKMNGLSIAQVEAQRQNIVEVIDAYRQEPTNMTPIDTYFVVRDRENGIAKIMPMRQDLDMIVERVRQAAHDVLLDTERQLAAGQRRPTVFERGQEYVRQSLGARAPGALEKFDAAEAALEDGTPESLAHALTSCRRMITSLADALYPATGDVIVGPDGRARTMSDDAYRNRLLQFAIEQLGNSTHRRLIEEALRSLGERLKRLGELSSKGVHGEVSRVEAETCLMWTYLTAADFLRIADGTSVGAGAPAPPADPT